MKNAGENFFRILKMVFAHKFFTVLLISMLCASVLFILKVPFIKYVNNDLSNSFTSAYVNNHGTKEFAGDYLWDRKRKISMGRFFDYLFKDVNNDTIENLYAHKAIVKLASLCYFFLFLGCFLIAINTEEFIFMGIVILMSFMNALPGFFEGWRIVFNEYGITANYFNCFVPLFLWSIFKYPNSAKIPIALILILANLHPASAIGFIVVSILFFLSQKRLAQVTHIIVGTICAFYLSSIISFSNQVDKIALTDKLLNFLTIRKGARLFLFNWDNNTPLPSSLKSYLFIFRGFLRPYWVVVAVTALLLYFRKRILFIKSVTQQTIVFFSIASCLPLIAIGATLLNRTLIITHFKPLFYNLEVVRIEKMVWPAFVFASILTLLNLYNRYMQRVRIRYILIVILSIFLIGFHFLFYKPERPIAYVIVKTAYNFLRTGKMEIDRQGRSVSYVLAEKFKVAKTIADLGYSNLYAPDDDFFRLELKKPIYFNAEEGGIALGAGQEAAEEWVRRYQVISSTDFKDAHQIKKLLDEEKELTGIILPYDTKYEGRLLKTIKINRHILILRN